MKAFWHRLIENDGKMRGYWHESEWLLIG